MKKYVTFSFDDGVLNDVDVIKVLDKHGAKGTFNINSGYVLIKNEPTCSHSRRTPEEIKSGIYGNHEIAAHGYLHIDMLEATKEQIEEDFIKDCENLTMLSGKCPIGCAYPYGLPQNRRDIAEIIAGCSPIRYGRTCNDNRDFKIPSDFLMWGPTMHWRNPERFDIIDKFINLPAEGEDRLLYIWGHSYEVEDDPGCFEALDKMLTILDKDPNVCYVTNGEIYERFGK